MVRPKVTEEDRRESLTIRLPNWVLTWLLKQQESSGVVIEEALIESHNLEKDSS